MESSVIKNVVKIFEYQKNIYIVAKITYFQIGISKEMQTEELNGNGCEDLLMAHSKSINADASFNASIDESSFCVDKALFEDLKINLKVKESLIESINDNLILKEAEIARLKARLSVIERKNLLNE